MAGTHFRIPHARALSCDVVHYHRQVPICPHSRVMNLSAVADARAAANRSLAASPSERGATRIGWPLLFVKAYALAAAEVPQLRQAWLPWRLRKGYQHPHSIGMLVLEREYDDERWLFWGKFPQPETTSLLDMQWRLDTYTQGDVAEIFKKQLQFSLLPMLLRRLIWSWNLKRSGVARAKRAGTFFVTTLASRGVTIDNPPAFHTGNLTYGPLDDAGRSTVTLSYDHRLLDGAIAAEFLIALEEQLTGAVTDELRSLTESRSTRAA